MKRGLSASAVCHKRVNVPAERAVAIAYGFRAHQLCLRYRNHDLIRDPNIEDRPAAVTRRVRCGVGQS
jgi:hypothetical protein